MTNLPDDIDYFDIPPLNQSYFENDKARQPVARVPISLQIDPDVLAWFRAQGQGWEKRMQAALRIYAEAHKDEPTP